MAFSMFVWRVYLICICFAMSVRWVASLFWSMDWAQSARDCLLAIESMVCWFIITADWHSLVKVCNIIVKLTMKQSSQISPNRAAKAKVDEIRAKVYSRQSSENYAQVYEDASSAYSVHRRPLETRQMDCANRIKDIDTINSKIRHALSKGKKADRLDASIINCLEVTRMLRPRDSHGSVFNTSVYDLPSEMERQITKGNPNLLRSKLEPTLIIKGFDQLVCCDSVELGEKEGKQNQQCQSIAQSRIQSRSTAACISESLKIKDQFPSRNESRLLEANFHMDFRKKSAGQSNLHVVSTQNNGSKSCSQKNKPEMKRLSLALSAQIELQIKFKQARQQFQHWKHPDKQMLLKQAYARSSPNEDISRIEEQISISSDQHNPFDEVTPVDARIIVTLFELRKDCNDHWRHQVDKAFSRSKLSQEGFDVSGIDLGAKGYLTVQDFVCFANLQTGKYYRNRDVVKMFKRMGKDRVEYSTFLATICG